MDRFRPVAPALAGGLGLPDRPKRGWSSAAKKPPSPGAAQHLRRGGSGRPQWCRQRASASSGLCRADALPACEQRLFSLHALGLRFYEALPSVGALGIFISGLHNARVTVGLGLVPRGLMRASLDPTKKPLPANPLSWTPHLHLYTTLGPRACHPH